MCADLSTLSNSTRFCLKIPTTGPGMAASKILNEEGIRTLGTMVFCLPQAVGASQAGCLYISPYYNGTSFGVVTEGGWLMSD